MESIEKYFEDKGIRLIYNCLGATDELIAAYIMKSCESLTIYDYSNKVKGHIYSQIDTLEPRDKKTGFEFISEKDQEIRYKIKGQVEIDGMDFDTKVVDFNEPKDYRSVLDQFTANIDKPLLYYSGGIDSELVLKSLLRSNNIPKIVIFEFYYEDPNKIINQYDIEYAYKFCNNNNLQYETFYIDLSLLWNDENFVKFGIKEAICSPQILTHIEMISIVSKIYPDHTHIFGGEVRYLPSPFKSDDIKENEKEFLVRSTFIKNDVGSGSTGLHKKYFWVSDFDSPTSGPDVYLQTIFRLEVNGTWSLTHESKTADGNTPVTPYPTSQYGARAWGDGHYGVAPNSSPPAGEKRLGDGFPANRVIRGTSTADFRATGTWATSPHRPQDGYQYTIYWNYGTITPTGGSEDGPPPSQGGYTTLGINWLGNYYDLGLKTRTDFGNGVTGFTFGPMNAPSANLFQGELGWPSYPRGQQRPVDTSLFGPWQPIFFSRMYKGGSGSKAFSTYTVWIKSNASGRTSINSFNLGFGWNSDSGAWNPGVSTRNRTFITPSVSNGAFVYNGNGPFWMLDQSRGYNGLWRVGVNNDITGQTVGYYYTDGDTNSKILTNDYYNYSAGGAVYTRSVADARFCVTGPISATFSEPWHLVKQGSGTSEFRQRADRIGQADGRIPNTGYALAFVHYGNNGIRVMVGSALEGATGLFVSAITLNWAIYKASNHLLITQILNKNVPAPNLVGYDGARASTATTGGIVGAMGGNRCWNLNQLGRTKQWGAWDIGGPQSNSAIDAWLSGGGTPGNADYHIGWTAGNNTWYDTDGYIIEVWRS